jgi:hypothetical protein
MDRSAWQFEPLWSLESSPVSWRIRRTTGSLPGPSVRRVKPIE